jgi:hypothetical protein
MSTVMHTSDDLPQPDAGEPQEVNGWKVGEPFFIATPKEDLLGTIEGFRFLYVEWYGRLKFDNGVKQSLPLRKLRKVRGA